MVTSLHTDETPPDAIDLVASDAAGRFRVRTPKLPISVNGGGEAAGKVRIAARAGRIAEPGQAGHVGQQLHDVRGAGVFDGCAIDRDHVRAGRGSAVDAGAGDNHGFGAGVLGKCAANRQRRPQGNSDIRGEARHAQSDRGEDGNEDESVGQWRAGTVHRGVDDRRRAGCAH